MVACNWKANDTNDADKRTLTTKQNKQKYIYISTNRLIGLVGRVFTSGPGDLGSIPGRVIPKTLKWYLILPSLTLSNIRYLSRIKWSNPGKGVAPSLSPRCSSYWKGSLLVAHVYGRQQQQLFFCNIVVTSSPNFINYIKLRQWRPPSSVRKWTQTRGWSSNSLTTVLQSSTLATTLLGLPQIIKDTWLFLDKETIIIIIIMDVSACTFGVVTSLCMLILTYCV